MKEKILSFSVGAGKLHSIEWKGAFYYGYGSGGSCVVFWTFQEERRETLRIRYSSEDAGELEAFLIQLEERVGTEKCLTSLIIAQLWPIPDGAMKVEWGRNEAGFSELAHELGKAIKPGGFFLRRSAPRGSGRKTEVGVEIYQAPTCRGEVFRLLSHWERPHRAAWNGGKWRRKEEER